MGLDTCYVFAREEGANNPYKIVKYGFDLITTPLSRQTKVREIDSFACSEETAREARSLLEDRGMEVIIARRISTIDHIDLDQIVAKESYETSCLRKLKFTKLITEN